MSGEIRVELFDEDGRERLGFLSPDGEWKLDRDWRPARDYPLPRDDRDEDDQP